MRSHHFELESIELTEETLKEFDVVILATDHDIYDYNAIREFSNIIIDTRGRFDPSENIYRS